MMQGVTAKGRLRKRRTPCDFTAGQPVRWKRPNGEKAAQGPSFGQHDDLDPDPEDPAPPDQDQDHYLSDENHYTLHHANDADHISPSLNVEVL